MWEAIAIGLFYVGVLLLTYCLCRMANDSDGCIEKIMRAKMVADHKEYRSNDMKRKSVKDNQ